MSGQGSAGAAGSVGTTKSGRCEGCTGEGCKKVADMVGALAAQPAPVTPR